MYSVAEFNHLILSGDSCHLKKIALNYCVANHPNPNEIGGSFHDTCQQYVTDISSFDCDYQLIQSV